jgi:hypothetical protein
MFGDDRWAAMRRWCAGRLLHQNSDYMYRVLCQWGRGFSAARAGERRAKNKLRRQAERAEQLEKVVDAKLEALKHRYCSGKIGEAELWEKTKELKEICDWRDCSWAAVLIMQVRSVRSVSASVAARATGQVSTGTIENWKNRYRDEDKKQKKKKQEKKLEGRSQMAPAAPPKAAGMSWLNRLCSSSTGQRSAEREAEQQKQQKQHRERKKKKKKQKKKMKGGAGLKNMAPLAPLQSWRTRPDSTVQEQTGAGKEQEAVEDEKVPKVRCDR